jgi:hypothetical protein
VIEVGVGLVEDLKICSAWRHEGSRTFFFCACATCNQLWRVVGKKRASIDSLCSIVSVLGNIRGAQIICTSITKGSGWGVIESIST